MPEIWPLTRRFTSGTMAKVAPAPAWGKNEQAMVTAMASGTGQADPSRAIAR
jgi:hypothetical protein